MGKGGGGTTTVQQDVPPTFKPAFTSLFNSAFGAARTAAGQDLGQRQNVYYPSGPFANMMTGGQPVYAGQQQQQQQSMPYQSMLDRNALYSPLQQPQAADSKTPSAGPGAVGNEQSTPFIQQSTSPFNLTELQQEQGITSGLPMNPAAWAELTGQAPAGSYAQTYQNPTTPTQPQASDSKMANIAKTSAETTPTSVSPMQQKKSGNFGTGFNQLPSGFTAPGSESIPLASGEPIIGQAYGGQFTAPSSPLELEALQQREQIARQLGGYGNNLMNLGQAQAGGAFLDPSTNPFFTQNLEASLQPAVDAFQRSVMPQFNSQALQSGAFKGSSAREFAAGNLANDFGRNLMQTAAQQGMQNYLQERMIQQQTPQLMDAAARLQQLSPEMLSQVGLGERELIQRMLDEQLMRFQEQQQAPFRPLGPLANIIQGTNVGLNTTQTVPTPSALAQGIAGALGGGSLGAGVANAMDWGGAKGGASIGIGSLLGLLGGAL